MSFLNHILSYEDLRDCTLITKNGTKIVVNIDSLEFFRDGLTKFEGCIMGIQTVEPKLSDLEKDYCQKDVDLQMDLYRTILNSTYGTKAFKTNYIPEIKNVIFNDPATIVFWDDGTKTVVKCQDGDEFDPEKGLAMAIVKKTYGNKGSYCNQLKKWLPKEEPVDNNHIILCSISEPKILTCTIDGDEFLKSFKKSISDALDVFKGTRCTPDDNSVSSKKRMTFREEEAKLHPEHISACWMGGVFGCPRDKEGNCTVSATDKTCRACWDRVIPDELTDND